VPADSAVLTPGQDRIAGQFGAVVADTQQRAGATALDGRRQLAGHACARQRCVSNQADALAGKVVEHHQDAEPPAVGQRVRGKVQ
jgi:hypothetical protein